MIATPEELAWAAGLFEGEGCFNVYIYKSGQVQVQAKLGSTDRDVVERFRQIVGVGRVQQPRQQGPNRKPMHTWSVYEAKNVVGVIQALLPWLGERRTAKALEVIKAAELIPLQPRARTHCPQGHPYAGENLGIARIAGRGIERYCRTCRKVYKQRSRGRAA